MLSEVASGMWPDGTRWVIRAGGQPDNCTTTLDITLPDGRSVGGGGHGGPALVPGSCVNVSVHRGVGGVRYLVGRVAPSVRILHICFANQGHSTDQILKPVATSEGLGVAFVAAMLPEEEIVAMIAFGAESSRPLETLPGPRSP